jgi:UDP-N-acetylmuramoyl-L-alanyl-D-glutamate--2,6-diaminopimelate ligase
MRLVDLIKNVEISAIIGELNPDFEITSVINDSRKSNSRALFVAYSGYREDVHEFIPAAYEKGVRHFIISKEKKDGFVIFKDAIFILVDSPRKALSQVAKNFYGDPTSQMKVIGITGTSGKTTTTFAIYKALRWMGKKAGLIGTIEYRVGDKIYNSTNTTPDILDLYEIISLMKNENVEYLVMEVSSHSLALGRVDGINFDICGFTNFSQDHLDFHKTMEEYLDAKLKIFDVLSSSNKNRKTLVVNKDIEVFPRIRLKASKYPNVKLKTISLVDRGADYYSRVVRLLPAKTVFELSGRNFEISMIGNTNVYNFSMAIAILKELGFPEREFSGGLAHIKVAGRMECVPNNLGLTIVIDYAHKPEALEKLIKTVRDVIKNKGKIITVFGCGGDRDRLKRPVMGKIACILSDYVIITSDNPRTEDPLKIIKEIEAGIIEEGKSNYEIIPDRKEAIFKGINLAKKNDCIIIAGKGHENYQIIGKEKIHFSDKEVVLESLGYLERDKGFLALEARKNLYLSLKFGVDYLSKNLNEEKKGLLVEGISQIIKDFYLLRDNRPLRQSITQLAMDYDNNFSMDDLKLLYSIEKALRTKNAFYSTLQTLSLEELKKIFDKISGVINETDFGNLQ